MIKEWQMFIEGLLLGWIFFYAFPRTFSDIKKCSPTTTDERQEINTINNYNISWRDMLDEQKNK